MLRGWQPLSVSYSIVCLFYTKSRLVEKSLMAKLLSALFLIYLTTTTKILVHVGSYLLGIKVTKSVKEKVYAQKLVQSQPLFE